MNLGSLKASEINLGVIAFQLEAVWPIRVLLFIAVVAGYFGMIYLVLYFLSLVMSVAYCAERGYPPAVELISYQGWANTRLSGLEKANKIFGLAGLLAATTVVVIALLSLLASFFA